MFLVLLFFTVLTIALTHQWRARKQLPRGPYPLPLIGNLHQLLYYCWKNGGLVEGYAEIQKSFGKVYTLWIGPLPTVFIADFEVAHETHVKRAHGFGTRYAPGLMNYNRFEDFASSNGICNKGRKIFEICARPFFDLLTGSVINKILINERFEQNDPEFEKLVSSLAKGFENTGFLDIFCPVHILESRFLKWRQDTIFEPFNYILELNKRSIARRVAQLEADQHVLSDDPDDFLDAYLLKMQKDKNEGLETTFTLENLAVDMYDLWLGGQETTSTTLNWACACLLNRPDVITTAREELIRVTGGHRSLSLTDRRETPYLTAVISEVQRFASILNINQFRIIKDDTVVDGQPLRAGTAVTAHIAMIHVDEDLFENHTEFRPERFLENDGLDKKLIPFGIGRRSCLGESLAKAELYLVLGNLLLDYDLEPVGEIPKLKTLAPFGLLKQSPEFRIRFVEVEKH